jgi:dTDP-4-dehydrorhamnose 3,5-epimerase
MNVVATSLPEVLIFEPKVFADPRGFFMESFNQRVFREATGLDLPFVQDNHSKSARGVLRGLHYQLQQAQGKLVRVTAGEVFDVAVDLRRSSPNFGKWTGLHLSGDNKRQLWVPPGFGHGFIVLSESAEFLYKTTDFYAPAYEKSVIWNDPDIGIDWPMPEGITAPALSGKDAAAPKLADAETYA